MEGTREGMKEKGCKGRYVREGKGEGKGIRDRDKG